MALEKYGYKEIPTSPKFNLMVDAVNANTEAVGKKVDKVTGKGLSTNDYTDDDKTQVGKVGELSSKMGEFSEVGHDALAPSVEALEGSAGTIDEVTAAALVEMRDYIDSLLNGITTRGKILMSKDVVNSLDGVSSLVPLSAYMGRILHDYALDNEEVIAAAINELATFSTLSAIAPQYNTHSMYAVGDYVVYEGSLYCCSTAIEKAEFFDATHWTKTNVIEVINSKTNN